MKPADTLLTPRPARERVRDASARSAVTVAGLIGLVALAGVAVFLGVEGWPGLTARTGLPLQAANFWALAWPLAFGSFWAAVLGLGLAVPVAIGVALAQTWYVPRWAGRFLGATFDILAAIPSVVYGLWGLMIIAPRLAPVYAWLGAHLSWCPLFAGPPSASGRTILTAALVLAVMVLPVMAALCREVFAQTPRTTVEAALALGATRWEVIRLAVWPTGKAGVVSGAMLGFGRAVGETMVTAMVISPAPFLVGFGLINSTNPNTIAAFIAQTFPESHGVEVATLLALGLVLFVITFVVNVVARRIVRATGGRV
ncbi:MAG: phosphate ABC transporter permease subunit PstC [Propionibacteriaceae bacterium]|jgi:phosphate transport system permease protein|nr:phosphate ABC transporter permease subunit PstC [Propionibacteriaceae bacterium]